MDKEKLRREFSNEWKKHYELRVLRERGFSRQKCKGCGKSFWSIEEREYCGDSECVGYSFIGKVGKKLGYIETWNVIKDYFLKTGHGYVKPFPTVARWRDDLYFTIASINDFQPYTVRGELEPIANPVIIPQPCIRFPDVDNVGVTGRHYTNFVMVGQLAFNTEKTGVFYWKEEAIEHDIGYLGALGIRQEDITFVEDVWAGGGNYGPSLEYFKDGLELGNCVFMQYEDSGKELNTKVIDMGAGLARLSWITHGTPTSYEIVMAKAVEYMKAQAGVDVDEKRMGEYAMRLGRINMEETKGAKELERKVVEEIGVDENELRMLQAIYATADHVLTVLFTTTDGMLPGNSGGGYNLRMILRRAFGFEQKFGWEWDYAKLCELHADFLEEMFPYLQEGVESTGKVIEEEKRKYRETIEKAGRKVEKEIAKGSITTEKLVELYKSNGIPPEYVAEEAAKKGLEIKVPENFYSLISEKEDIAERGFDLKTEGVEKTEPLYYGKEGDFEAIVLRVDGNYIVLDRSAFYPEGGGQACDKGKINEEEVVEVFRKDGVIFHKVRDASKFREGMKVRCSVDIERRKRIAKHHTAAHLINAAARAVLGRHCYQAGAKKSENIAHLDITHYKRIEDNELKEMERMINKWIREERKISIEIIPRNIAEQKYGFGIYQGGAVPGKELRIVIIEGVDVEACGGTHQMHDNIGEFGLFKIVRREGVQDGVERIVYKVGEAALEYVHEQEEYLSKSASVFRVAKEDLPKTSERFFNEWKELRKEVERLEEAIVEKEMEKARGKDYVEEIVEDSIIDRLLERMRKEGVKGALLIGKQGKFGAFGEKGIIRAKEVVYQCGGSFGGKEVVKGRLKEVKKYSP
ncbi:MAG: alanine--tRNA ligase [Candidatus Anstonellales archaeon]